MDPDNIFQILMGQDSQGGASTNVLQGMTPQAQPDPATRIAQAATAASPPTPKPRRSLLDTLGRISDVVAKVGGADPLYQPTLDARQDRARLIDLEGLKKTLTEQQIAAGALEPQVAERKRIGTALGALAGHEGDAATLWPQIAEQAGIDPQKATAIGHILAANPASAGILAKSLGADIDNLGKNVFFGTNTDGKTVAYQVGPDGHPHVLDFGDGITPSEPTKIVNTGPTSVVVGQSGNVKKILPNGVSPNTAATNAQSNTNNERTTGTALKIAGMPARAKDGTAASAKASDPRAGLKIISDIQTSFDNLHRMQALPGEGSAAGNLIGTLGRTQLGQAIGAKTGLSQAAQERELLAKNLANLQSDLIKSLPGNATRTKFEQEIQKKRLPDPASMNYDTANRAIAQIREAYMTALRSQAATPSKITPANNGWTVVGVK